MQTDAHACFPLQPLGLLQKNLCQPAADGAETYQTYFDLFHGPPCPALFFRCRLAWFPSGNQALLPEKMSYTNTLFAGGCQKNSGRGFGTKSSELSHGSGCLLIDKQLKKNYNWESAETAAGKKAGHSGKRAEPASGLPGTMIAQRLAARHARPENFCTDTPQAPVRATTISDKVYRTWEN
jgi:hypothetical protein